MDKCALEALAWNPIECNIKHQKMIFQRKFRQSPEMALRISRAHPEVRLRFQSNHAGTQELNRTKQYVLLESLDVDFDKIGFGNQAFGQQAIQAPDRHCPDLLRRVPVKSFSPPSIHRAFGWIDRIEVEGLLAINVAHGHAVVMPIGAAAVLFGQLLHNLLDGIEAVHNEMITQWAPTNVLATLHPDVDQYEGFRQKPRAHHPLGEVRIVVDAEVHLADLLVRQLWARGWTRARTKTIAFRIITIQFVRTYP